MEGEIYNYVKVWLLVSLSLCYCYFTGKAIPKGTKRLICVLPIVSLFFYLPLKLHTMHLGGTTAFFIAWLANFKLLLLALGQGPLASDPSISLPRFITLACLPIKIQQSPPAKSHQTSQISQNPSQKSHPNGQITETPYQRSHPNGQIIKNPSQKSQENGYFKENPDHKRSKKGQKSPFNYAIKALLLAILIQVYSSYGNTMHPKLLLVLYCPLLYLPLEIILAIVASLARAILGIELEPQFDEPYLSSSLQDFWGRRWNIMASNILRPTVYDPVRSASARAFGRKWSPLPAVLATFTASGLMHELIFYYLGRVTPTWEVTWFFLLHGVCVAAEIVLKKTLASKWRLPKLMSCPLTIGFVMVTGFWLFFPQLIRCRFDQRGLEEYAAVGSFLQSVGRLLVRSSSRG